MTQAKKGGWTLRRIRTEIDKTKRLMSESGTQTITATEFGEVTDSPYNTAYVTLRRASIKQYEEGNPAKFDRLQALELAERTLERRDRRKRALVDLTAQTEANWIATGVPQPRTMMAAAAGIPQGSAHRKAREAVERGGIYIVEARGSEFYLPVGACVKKPKQKPDLSALDATKAAAYKVIVNTYCKRLVPASMVEIGEAIKNKFPRHPVFKLVELGLVKEIWSGEQLMFLPVGYEAAIRKKE